MEFPELAHAKAFDKIEESILYRHVMPEACWKLQRWLQIGREKKLSRALKVFDGFVYECISSNRKELSQRRTL